MIIDHHLPPDYLDTALRADVLAGLTDDPKWLPPKWFYDERGSVLFDRITELPEYYPTRAEREILLARAAEIAEHTGAATVLELGSGSSEKTRALLDALRATGTLRRYVPVDVSEAALRSAAQAIETRYPGLDVHAVVADFEHHLGRLPEPTGPGDRRLMIFLGGTVGNLFPAQRSTFLADVRASLRPGDWFLLGTDLVKSPDVLVPAYDDSLGVTAEFNKNVLAVLNRELKAEFDLDAFVHRAVWNAADEWIEMRLRSVRDQVVRVEMLDLEVHLRRGEEIRTEISAKFRVEGVRSELHAAGLHVAQTYLDAGRRFAVTLARVL